MGANSTTLSNMSMDTIGRALGVAGAVSCLAYPVYFAAFVYDSNPVPADPGKFLMLMGACVAVWGAAVVRAGRLRSLTAEQALLIPVIVLGASVMMDLLTWGRMFYIFGRGHELGLIVAKLSAALPAVIIGASTFPVVGAALRQRRPAWAGASVLLVVAAIAFAVRPNTQGMPWLITAVGLPTAAFGYLVGDRT